MGKSLIIDGTSDAINKERGDIITKMIQIEFLVDLIIIEHFKPENKKDFSTILLNSSIITFGAKCKILRNIPLFNKKIVDRIEYISNIRNAFAHCELKPPMVEIKLGHDKTVSDIKIGPRTLIVMNSSGVLKTKIAENHYKDFTDSYDEIRSYLSSFIK